MSGSSVESQPEAGTPPRTWGFGCVSVVIPAHNEEEAIEDDLAQVFGALDPLGIDFEVIVVDDGSTDRTAELVRRWDRVVLLQHPVNRGTGAGLKTGIQAARGDVIVMTDADGTYPNDRMPDLLALMDRYDLVIGARRNEAGTMPWLRAPAKWFIRSLASYMTGTRIPDLNSGLRAFRRDAALQFFGILPQGHSWVSTITIAMLSNGYAVTWIPIDYFARKGKSHFRPIKDTYNYLSLVVRTVMYFDPLRIFLPVALLLLAFAAVKAGADVVRYDWRIATGTVLVAVTGLQLLGLGLLADLVVRTKRL